MKSNKTILIAIVLGLLAVVLVNAYVSRLQSKAEEPKVTFFRATADILPGQTVREALKRKVLQPVREIPASFAKAYPEAIDGKEYEVWADRRIEHAIPAGEFLLAHHLRVSSAKELARMIPDGHALIAIPATADTTVGFLATPGDIVDVYYTVTRKDPKKPGGMSAEAVSVARALKVFAVDDYYGPQGDLVRPRGRAYGSITLSGPRAEVERVIAATKLGRLTLTLPSRSGG
ncbi:MAG: Flp pilus assembly protein CpaB [Planctomycetota bacterium]